VLKTGIFIHILGVAIALSAIVYLHRNFQFSELQVSFHTNDANEFSESSLMSVDIEWYKSKLFIEYSTREI